MSINFVRKIFHKFGFDVIRFRPKVDKINWLKTLKIKTVIDVGANVGQFAKEIRGVLPDVFIYSFEPLKGCFEKLNKIMSNDKKFKAFNFAIGEKKETIQMNKNEYSPSSSILDMEEKHKEYFPHTKKTTREMIAVVPLDKIEEIDPSKIEKNILLKIDTQGFEDKVIKGGLSFLQHTKVIIIENSYVSLYKEQALFNDIYKTLTSMGFVYKGALHEKLDPATGEILFEDSFFLR